jgi:hypothetical protein
MQEITNLLGISIATVTIPVIDYKDGIGVLSKKDNRFLLEIERPPRQGC